MGVLAREITKLESFGEQACLNFQSIDVLEIVNLEERLVRVVSNLRFAVNAARSPVNRLSPILLSQIFAYLHTPETPPRHHPPGYARGISNELITVNLVCRYWRKTAIIHIAMAAVAGFEHWSEKRPEKVGGSGFEMMRMLNEGHARKVLVVRHKPTSDLFVLKAIMKRHPLAEREVDRALTEGAVLSRMTAAESPFVAKLRWSFDDTKHLFLVMDFHPGGDLATQLARLGRFGRDQARFYAAEIVEGVGTLHKNGVVYRGLKPENTFIGSDGHIVLTNFGLSRVTPCGPYDAVCIPPDGNPNAGTEPTSTFGGAVKYAAPEVTQGLPYSFEADWWSFGMTLYEMLTGTTPFGMPRYSLPYSIMYQKHLRFPVDCSIDQDAKSLIRCLLQRDPALRIKESEIKSHSYFAVTDWSRVRDKGYVAPYIPPINPSNAGATPNFDGTLLDVEPKAEDAGWTDILDDTEDDDSFTVPLQSRSPSVDSQWSETSSEPGKSTTLRGPHTLPRSLRHTGKQGENPGVAALDKHPGGGAYKSTQPGRAGFAADLRKLAVSMQTSSRHECHPVPGMTGASGVEAVSPSPTQRQGRGRAPLHFRNKSSLKTPPTVSVSPATHETSTAAGPSSMGWRKREESRLTGITSESTRGARLTGTRSRYRGVRSSSPPEGHQSPDDDGESKKKVDWVMYDE